MSVPADILELMDDEGGWWTADTLSETIGASKNTVRRSLYRLADRGLIRGRLTEKTGTTTREVGRGAWSRYKPGERVEVTWRTPVNEWTVK